MITTNNICKNFGDFQALKEVSFTINSGEIVGFLGQNGAGKTTLMRILTSYIPASSGTVLIDGEDVRSNSLAIRRKIGYLPETPPLYANMTVKDYLKFAAEIKGVPAKLRRRQLERVLAECQLEDAANKTIATLSKGYKQRTGIAQAIIHDPDILILDEPTSGLDPIQNLQLRNLIKNQQQQRTVLLSTHILSEIEQIADRVLMIKAGEIIIDESLDVLLNPYPSDQSRASTLEQVFLDQHVEPVAQASSQSL
jgi:ABC-2 type transport system ATP-binding protein